MRLQDRELDDLVASKVMGWRSCENARVPAWEDNGVAGFLILKAAYRPSTEIIWAWSAAEHVTPEIGSVEVMTQMNGTAVVKCSALQDGEIKRVTISGHKAPRGICLALLLAYGEDVEVRV